MEGEREICAPAAAALRPRRWSRACDCQSGAYSQQGCGTASARRERQAWRHLAPPGTDPPSPPPPSSDCAPGSVSSLKSRRRVEWNEIKVTWPCLSREPLPPPPWPSRLVVCLLLVMGTFLVVPAAASSLSPINDLKHQKETGVCSSIDIRNTPKMFDKLKGCRVVEGFLQILLIDHFDESAYANLTFPELREITGYLMMYRVKGLKSLTQLFPNLSVIRGHVLFSNYALIIYEMMKMQEIGLYSLTDISRGSVRIEKNFNLCYVDTIDWNLIARNGIEENYIKDNKAANECPVCPRDDGGESNDVPMTMLCPEAPNPKVHNARQRLCWNSRHCQKICTGCNGRACTATGKCCDDSCLGGCTGFHNNNCTVCRNFSIGDISDRKCIQECPPGTFKHHDRRCITEQECRNISRPRELTQKLEKPYKPINGTCMLDCPANFYEYIENDMTFCAPCQGVCKRECYGGNIDTIQAAQSLRGCTYITGSLEINVRGGGNIVSELEEGLGLITDIVGSLKVVRSYALVSLNFLKSLRRIHGLNSMGKVMKDNVFSVTDNQNLQELWDWDKHKDIEILHGKLFFHFNPKLCFDKIEALRRMAPESEFTDLEVARNSNGDKVACNVTLLNVTIGKVTHGSIIITWDIFKYDDSRSLLGYVVYSIEAPNRNVTLYEGRDACGGDGWRVDDVPILPKATQGYYIMTHLKPYTQYAFYVKTYTIAAERMGAQSPIHYVKTLPGEPSPPHISEVSFPDPNSMLINWMTSLKPNGNVTKYRVYIYWDPDNENMIKQRNYCKEGLEVVPPKKRIVVDFEKQSKEREGPQDEDGKKCSCEEKRFPNAEEIVNKITFEDNLQNQVFQKRFGGPPDMNRKRRDVNNNDLHLDADSYGSQFPEDEHNIIMPQHDYKTELINGYYEKFVTVVENRTLLTVNSLKHFAPYAISVWACREYEKEELSLKPLPENCSVVSSLLRVRTTQLPGADDISEVHVKVQQSNQSLGIVRIEWEEPVNPNGFIVTYTLKCMRVDVESTFHSTDCITRQQYLNNDKSYTIKHLNSGNYSIRIMATSLAGSGNYSADRYFYIEEPETKSVTVVIGITVALIIVFVSGLIFYYVRRYFAPPMNLPKTLIADVNPEYINNIYVPDEWEVSRSSIEIIKELGQGSFGMVYEGIGRRLPKVDKPEIHCAIKTINEHATERERSDFLKEASVMKAFDTSHVVRLLGVVSYGQPTLVVMELMAFGDLKSYLRSHRPEQEKPKLSRITQMAMEIADGMAYLSAKKFVHRDLAARNCMVAGDLTVKVGDFGMTRDIYETDYYRKGSKGLLPVRWMSPESLKDGVFTSSSDAWSYGVVLWEMATLASQPYQGLSNDQVLRYVIDGGVMERPENCPDKLYQLMQLTWQHRPNLRPSFMELVARLATDATAEFRVNSFFFSVQGQELYQQMQQTAGVVEETGPSMTPTHIASWERHALASAESDSSPVASTPRAPISPLASYRERIRLVPFSDKTRGDPHELEALVGMLSHSAPPPPMPFKSSPSSPPLPVASNGYLACRNNNGNRLTERTTNPISLSASTKTTPFAVFNRDLKQSN